MAMTYSEKLKDPRWQRKRLEILQRDDWACCNCGAKTETLHVHHGYYERGLDPWEYRDDTLWTLCEGCHELITECLSDIHMEIGRCSPILIQCGLMTAINDCQRIDDYDPELTLLNYWSFHGMTRDEKAELIEKINALPEPENAPARMKR